MMNFLSPRLKFDNFSSVIGALTGTVLPAEISLAVIERVGKELLDVPKVSDTELILTPSTDLSLDMTGKLSKQPVSEVLLETTLCREYLSSLFGVLFLGNFM